MIEFPETIILDGMHLRPLTDADVAELHTLTNHPHIADIISFLSYPVSRSFAEEWIRKNETQTDRVYGIFSHEGILMGQIGAHLTGDATEIEIGYWMGVDYWGKGIATKATSELAKALQNLNPTHQIIAECLPDNVPSLRVLEKSGFRQTHQPGHRPGRTRLVFTADVLGSL